MGRSAITLYFDIVSPFAYLAFYVLHNSPEFKDCEIKYIPILLGGLIKTSSNVPPINVKNKGKWTDRERRRWGQHLKVPMSEQVPPGFPMNTLSVQRTLTALSLSHPASLPAAVALIYHNLWAQYTNPLDPSVLLKLLSTALGSEQDAQAVIDASKTEEVKKKLMQNTTDAFEDGAFGLPWISATNEKGETERVFGVDRLGLVCDHLGVERPVTEGWRALL